MTVPGVMVRIISRFTSPFAFYYLYNVWYNISRFLNDNSISYSYIFFFYKIFVV